MTLCVVKYVHPNANNYYYIYQKCCVGITELYMHEGQIKYAKNNFQQNKTSQWHHAHHTNG